MKPRGLAGTCKEVRKRVASMGGKAAWKTRSIGKKMGFNPQTASEAGKKGAKIRWEKYKLCHGESNLIKLM